MLRYNKKFIEHQSSLFNVLNHFILEIERRKKVH